MTINDVTSTKYVSRIVETLLGMMYEQVEFEYTQNDVDAIVTDCIDNVNEVVSHNGITDVQKVISLVITQTGYRSRLFVDSKTDQQ